MLLDIASEQHKSSVLIDFLFASKSTRLSIPHGKGTAIIPITFPGAKQHGFGESLGWFLLEHMARSF